MAFGCAGSSLLCGLFSRYSELGLLFAAMCGLLSALASLVVEHMLEALRLQKLGLPGPRAQAQELWCMGFIAPQHVGPS